MTDTKMRTLVTIQLNRQILNFQSYPKPKKQFVCSYGKKNTNKRRADGYSSTDSVKKARKRNPLNLKTWV